MLVNWRGLHGALVRALRKRYGFWGYLVYLDSLAERTRVALEADCILAITGVERSGPGCRPPANLGHCGCGGIHFRIPAGSLYPSVSHYCVSGLDQRR